MGKKLKIISLLEEKGPRKEKLFETSHGNITATQIAEIVGVNTNTILQRVRVYGATAPEVLFPKSLRGFAIDGSVASNKRGSWGDLKSNSRNGGNKK